MLFVSDGGSGSQEERAQDHCRNEGKTEEGERVLCEKRTVSGGHGAIVRARAETFGWEDGHLVRLFVACMFGRAMLVLILCFSEDGRCQ